MQRIDENTYIDDSLVTCAEYQLFIDEMREQGKYYQPDHWASYQFPEGQAGEPVLGVRHSDAVAFCEWLTQRENKEWQYRLPTQKEIVAFPIKPIGINPLGYWANEDYQFIWIETIPEDDLELDIDRAKDFLDRKNKSFQDSLLRAITKILVRAQNIISVNAPNGIREGFSHTIVRARKIFARTITRTFNLDRILVSALNRDFDIDRDRDRDIDQAIARAYDLIHDFNLGRAVDIFRNHALNFDNDLDSLHEYTHYLNHEQALDFDIDRSLILDIYVDLFILEERIAGRSPAFEGIRLVKERTR